MGGKNVLRFLEARQDQNLEEEHGCSKAESKEVRIWTALTYQNRDSQNYNIGSKASEARQTKEQEGSIGGAQGASESGKDCIQMELVFSADPMGLVGKGGELARVSQQGKDSLGRGILIELDQNRGGYEGMAMESRKLGLWKRRARANQTYSGKENEQRKTHKKTGLGSKWGFQLTDEGEEADEYLQSGKKPKGGAISLQLTETQVKVASQKWPQTDQ